ncbi:hypothetical protein Poli38472_011041 [Pythium oligandrum]|uniref:Uncharacterized protein n=1 Tax=Pythium oligandrum TaxID=41045 RepID=A0A8K1CRN3_PYTOL|nr:hypothetical protein Poli38472_011041 [Pythium oligandrum]|eukprot:TMW67421.1 hypothetical protein Poli38472_011041 [Pythium oligandrum]
MDAILSRLDPQQLRQFCADAAQQELRDAVDLLFRTLTATKRLEEVQDAALKLRFAVFRDEDALRAQLEELNAIRTPVVTSLDRIMQLQAITEPSRFQKATLDAAIQTKAMMRTPSKERSDAMEELLSKLLAAVDTCCWSSKAERSASMSDLLNLISDYLVSQLSKHKSNITQERLLKLSHGMQREQSKWGVFEKAIPALKTHLYKNFVVLPHQTDKFKARVEKAIEIVGGWEAEGRPVCAISEFMEQMEVLREVMTCQFKAWHPRGDPNVHKLTNLLWWKQCEKTKKAGEKAKKAIANHQFAQRKAKKNKKHKNKN